MEADAVYTNKPPGGIAYRCSFRVTEAVHAIERITDRFAFEIGKDPAELRMQNFIKKEDFPSEITYRMGYMTAVIIMQGLKKQWIAIDYDWACEKSKLKKRKKGEN